MDCSAKVSKVPEVSREVEQLQREVAKCNKDLAKLEDRLGMVLRQEPKVPTVAGGGLPEQSCVPLAEKIKIEGNSVRRMGENITSIIQRIEL